MFRQDCQEIADFNMGKSDFKNVGCAVCSVFHHVEQLTGKYFSVHEVMRKCMDLIAEKIIDNDFYINSWDNIFYSFNLPVKTRFESADYKCKDDEIEILFLQKPGYKHFVPGDGKGNYSWDSLGRREAQGDYYIKDKRIMRLL